MSFQHGHYLDLSNQLVIYQTKGVVSDPDRIESMLKTAIRLANSHHYTGILLDMRELVVVYEKSLMLDVMIRMRDENWLGDLRMARLIIEKGNYNQLIGDICQKYNLPIRNFESRNKAITWLVNKR